MDQGSSENLKQSGTIDSDIYGSLKIDTSSTVSSTAVLSASSGSGYTNITNSPYYLNYSSGGALSWSSGSGVYFSGYINPFIEEFLTITAHLSEKDFIEILVNTRRNPKINEEIFDQLIENIIFFPQVRKLSEESLIELLGFCKNDTIKNRFEEFFAKELESMPALNLLLQMD